MSHKMKPHTIYEIEFPDGMIYVGCTVDLGRRIKQHFYKPCKSLKKHMDKTGYSLEDATISVAQKVMYKAIGLRIEKGKIKHYHKKGICLNYYRGKQVERLTEVRVNGEVKILLSDGTLVDKEKEIDQWV